MSNKTYLPVSADLLRDCVVDIELALGLREPTAKEKAAAKRYERRLARLKAEGRLDDGGWEKEPDDCPVRWYYSNEDDARCELKIGHSGPHEITFTHEGASNGD